mgnify:CR=1 FL=1
MTINIDIVTTAVIGSTASHTMKRHGKLVFVDLVRWGKWMKVVHVVEVEWMCWLRVNFRANQFECFRFSRRFAATFRVE